MHAFLPFIQHLDCLYLLGSHSRVVGKCLPSATPMLCTTRLMEKLHLVPVSSYFHCSKSHIFLATTSADGPHNAWNPDITQDPEGVLRLHTLLIYRHAGELWSAGDSSLVPSLQGRLSGWRWMTLQRTWQHFGLQQGSPRAHTSYRVLVVCDGQSGTNFWMEMLEFTVCAEKNNNQEFRHLHKILVCFNGKMSTISPQRGKSWTIKENRMSLHPRQWSILCRLAGRFGEAIAWPSRRSCVYESFVNRWKKEDCKNCKRWLEDGYFFSVCQ